MITAILIDQQNHTEALKWAMILLKFPNRDYSDDYIVIGEIYLKLNKKQQVFEMFEKAYQSGKARAFKHHDTAWAFYKNY